MIVGEFSGIDMNFIGPPQNASDQGLMFNNNSLQVVI